MNTFIQIAIAILGGLTVYLLASTNPRYQKIGCKVGLIAQPFWLYGALSGKQWGIAVLVIWYAYSYFKGMRSR